MEPLRRIRVTDYEMAQQVTSFIHGLYNFSNNGLNIVNTSSKDRRLACLSKMSWISDDCRRLGYILYADQLQRESQQSEV